ncbi:hypothetical protein [Paenibacillus humicus]
MNDYNYWRSRALAAEARVAELERSRRRTFSSMMSCWRRAYAASGSQS